MQRKESRPERAAKRPSQSHYSIAFQRLLVALPLLDCLALIAGLLLALLLWRVLV